MRGKAIAVLGIAGLCIGLAYHFTLGSKDQRKRPKYRVEPKKPLELCLLFGDMKDSKINTRHGMDALGNMLRMRFEALDIEDCKETAMNFCQTNLEKGFIPGKVGLLIRSATQTERYTVSKDCVFAMSHAE